MHDYNKFFKKATGCRGYPYQQRLVTVPWPELVEVETGLGKTAAVICAWLYKRSRNDADTPRRLVFCLPMRTLVEQTKENACKFVERTADFFDERPEVHVLMGGETDSPWDIKPDQHMILVGTQDMLLSRALMRGYGMSRYKWPLHFAWLHNDTLWVFDEVQLMGSGVGTSAQLEAFRREFKNFLPSRSLWMSATLDRRHLETVDFKSDAKRLEPFTLGVQDYELPAVNRRYKAVKYLKKVEAVNPDKDGYANDLAEKIIREHQSGTTTLVIVNNVTRAQNIFKTLNREKPTVLLLHGRFRGQERSEKMQELNDTVNDDRIVIATQVVEAGVDMTSAVLFTELASWSSMVQRFGRCNRDGQVESAKVFWIDIPIVDTEKLDSEDFEKFKKSNTKNAAPYTPEEIDCARKVLDDLQDVGLASLPPMPEESLPIHSMLRRRDLLGLFDTDPDLLGFNADISPYIRDRDDANLQVFWREFKEQPPEDEPRPTRNELCRVSVRDLKKIVGKGDKKKAFYWDSFARKWLNCRSLHPGLILMLSSFDGGYDTKTGFGYAIKNKVPVVQINSENIGVIEEGYSDDQDSTNKKFPIELADHLKHVHTEAERLVDVLNLGELGGAVARAAAWHDVGKAHGTFQDCMVRNFSKDDPRHSKLWAKSTHNYRMKEPFRHELASALAFLDSSRDNGNDRIDHDLIAYLIAAHHGKVRMSIRSLPNEQKPDMKHRKARGVTEGDNLPEVRLPKEETFQGANLSLDLMELGEGKQGPSWTMRTQALLKKYGPFQLAFLEACVIAADRCASRDEQQERAHA